MSNLDVHKRIKKALEETEKDSPYICQNIELIAKQAGTDTRTAKKHLTLLEEDGLGHFCDPKKKTFRSEKDSTTEGGCPID